MVGVVAGLGAAVIFDFRLFRRRCDLFVAVMSKYSAVVAGGTLGRTAGGVDDDDGNGALLAGTLGRSLSVECSGLVAFLKMSLSCSRANRVCVFALGRISCRVDCLRAFVRSWAAAMMVSLGVAVGIFNLCGNQSMVLTIRVALLEGVQTLKQR